MAHEPLILVKIILYGNPIKVSLDCFSAGCKLTIKLFEVYTTKTGGEEALAVDPLNYKFLSVSHSL